jgi:hypothetical protein
MIILHPCIHHRPLPFYFSSILPSSINHREHPIPQPIQCSALNYPKPYHPSHAVSFPFTISNSFTSPAKQQPKVTTVLTSQPHSHAHSSLPHGFNQKNPHQPSSTPPHHQTTSNHFLIHGSSSITNPTIKPASTQSPTAKNPIPAARASSPRRS